MYWEAGVSSTKDASALYKYVSNSNVQYISTS